MELKRFTFKFKCGHKTRMVMNLSTLMISMFGIERAQEEAAQRLAPILAGEGCPKCKGTEQYPG